MTTPLRAALFVAHIAVAVVALGALGATGLFARAVRVAFDPFANANLRRFFRPGHNLAARAIYLVPLLGFGLLMTGPSGDWTRAYPWIGLGLWAISIGIATGAIWPAESAIQRLLSGSSEPSARSGLKGHCRTIELGSIAITLTFLAAFAVMVIQI